MISPRSTSSPWHVSENKQKQNRSFKFLIKNEATAFCFNYLQFDWCDVVMSDKPDQTVVASKYLSLYPLCLFCLWVWQTWVEVPSRVESSAVDGGGESVTADGLGDVGIEVSIKPKSTQTDHIWEIHRAHPAHLLVELQGLFSQHWQIYDSTALFPVKPRKLLIQTNIFLINNEVMWNHEVNPIKWSSVLKLTELESISGYIIGFPDLILK